jgi:four helix bundle protein
VNLSNVARLRAQGTGLGAQKNEISKVMEDFRFEQLDIWKEAIEVSDVLFDYADNADNKRLYKFAEQLRAAAMSISNNIAEGSGSFSDKEFASFLNISRRSIFECANILCIYVRRNVITFEEKATVYTRLLKLSKMITNFRKTITSNYCSEP